MADENPITPREISEERAWFDRLADTMANAFSRAPFFLAGVGFVLVWAALGPVVGFSHGWVDTFEIVVALVTFLMVALLQNEGWRGSKATQRKLNAVASALAELMERSGVDDEEVQQLNAAVGLEKRESASR
jgi:low affinity Fe/Cu permease